MSELNTTEVNIGIRERKVRRVLGYLLLVGAIIAGILFVLSDPHPLWSLVLFYFFYQGIRFLLDYQTGTCPVKSELGQQKRDAQFISILGKEMEDTEMVRKIRNKSRRALVQSGLGGAGLTLLTLLGMFLLN